MTSKSWTREPVQSVTAVQQISDREIPVVLGRFDDVLNKGVGAHSDVFPIAPIACESGLRISGKMFKHCCLP